MIACLPACLPASWCAPPRKESAVRPTNRRRRDADARAVQGYQRNFLKARESIQIGPGLPYACQLQ